MSFHGLIDHFHVLEKCLYKPFAHFKIVSFVFLWWGSKIFLKCIVDISPWSDMWFENVLSHFVSSFQFCWCCHLKQNRFSVLMMSDLSFFLSLPFPPFLLAFLPPSFPPSLPPFLSLSLMPPSLILSLSFFCHLCFWCPI